MRRWRLFLVVGLLVCGVGAAWWWHAINYCELPQPTISTLIAHTSQPIQAQSVAQLAEIAAIEGTARSRAAFSPNDHWLVSIGIASSVWGNSHLSADSPHCSVTWIVDVSGNAPQPQVVVNNSGIVPHWLWLVPDLSFNHDGSLVALNNLQKQIISVPSGQELARLEWSEDPFFTGTVLFSPDDKRLFAAVDSQILVWDATTFAFGEALAGHTDHVGALGFGDNLISASSDGMLRSWNLETGEGTIIYQTHAENLINMDVGLKGKIAVSYLNHAVILDEATGAEYMDLMPGTVQFSVDERSVMSYSYKDLWVWDVQNQRLLTRIQVGADVQLRTATFDPTGELIGAGFSDGTLNVYSVTGERLLSEQVVEAAEITDVAFNHMGTLLAVSWRSDNRWRGGVQLWGVE
ncbi:MAG: WD40 repeat domain-containing protein [Anaerolineae bacterium]|nr:WD40 repeat domain-containing protein [Anaerolineae bacterium]